MYGHEGYNGRAYDRKYGRTNTKPKTKAVQKAKRTPLNYLCRRDSEAELKEMEGKERRKKRQKEEEEWKGKEERKREFKIKHAREKRVMEGKEREGIDGWVKGKRRRMSFHHKRKIRTFLISFFFATIEGDLGLQFQKFRSTIFL